MYFLNQSLKQHPGDAMLLILSPRSRKLWPICIRLFCHGFESNSGWFWIPWMASLLYFLNYLATGGDISTCDYSLLKWHTDKFMWGGFGCSAVGWGRKEANVKCIFSQQMAEVIEEQGQVWVCCSQNIVNTIFYYWMKATSL